MRPLASILISAGEELMRHMETGNVLKFVPHIGLTRFHYTLNWHISSAWHGYVKWHTSSVWYEFVRMSSDIISLTRVC